MNNYQVVVLQQSQINVLPAATTTGQCIIGPAIVTSSDVASYLIDSANTSHHIQDTETYYALLLTTTNLGTWPAADVNVLPVGSPQPLLLNGHNHTNSIISGADGSSWEVDGGGVRHSIPYTQDYVCWHDKVGLSITGSNLAASQIDSLTPGSTGSCIIGPADVTANGGGSYYVDNTNTKYGISDIPTYWWYVDNYGSYTWPAADVANILRSSNLTDPFNGKIINSPKNNAYFVGTNSKLYWIPGGVGGAVFNCLTGSGHNVKYLGSVPANVVDNFNNSNGYVASCP